MKVFKRYISSSFDSVALLRTNALVNGEWLRGGSRFPVTNPSTTEVFSKVTDCGVPEYRKAIEAAHLAFKTFRHTSSTERSQLLYNVHELIQEYRADLARLITVESGKPIWSSLREVETIETCFRVFAEEASRLNTHSPIPSTANLSQRWIIYEKQPLGVLGIVTDWALSTRALRNLAAVIATGNTCIFQPPKETPMTALALGYVCTQAGVQEGVLNILPTSQPENVARYLCESRFVKKTILETRTTLRHAVLQRCSTKICSEKIVSRPYGKGSFIVCKDADIEKALRALVACRFGQFLEKGSFIGRVFVHESLYDEFNSRLISMIDSEVCLGDGFDPNATYGPLINGDELNMVANLIQDARKKGAIVLRGGVRASSMGPNFYRPTVLSNVDDTMNIVHTENCAPIVPVSKFRSLDETLDYMESAGSDSVCYLYATDIRSILSMTRKLNATTLGINSTAIEEQDLRFPEACYPDFGNYTALKNIVLEP
ncbi:LADA_0F09274g1_1 [Lachancea dasiensis]|uniref:LADA_0F09274g1_1 n=1 Tax=Lachancea dasiensis TaxID=1072105 RepID=A0A1G4JLE2_9SACH|nr:LADA_0F09274g1_1 [Lachancea dasiensis]